MAPIIMFVYNKPGTTLETLQMLEQNIGAENSDLYIYSDGPKQNLVNTTNADAVSAVREIINRKYNFKSCTVIESETNKGLARSVIGGVTEILKTHETAIIIEDDVLTSKYFIQHMNQQLSLYRDEENVASIGSWNYYHPSTSNFFLRVTDSIAWGVYRRSWKDFEPDSTKLLAEVEGRNLTQKFDFDGAYEFSKMLQAQSDGKVDSWAIRWYATNFLKSRFCLYPSVSLTKHIGNVKGAAHSDDPEDIYRQTFDVTNHHPSEQKVKIEESNSAVRSYKQFHHIQDNTRVSLLSRIKSLFR